MVPLERAALMPWRAVRLRCPNCGSGGLWQSYFKMRPACPRCGLHLERGEQGYIVGAQMFNLIAAELVFAGIFVTVLLATWPDPPWELLQYGGMALMVTLPFLFYPFSKTVFLAFDLIFRPPRPEDFDGQGAGTRDQGSGTTEWDEVVERGTDERDLRTGH